MWVSQDQEVRGILWVWQWPSDYSGQAHTCFPFTEMVSVHPSPSPPYSFLLQTWLSCLIQGVSLDCVMIHNLRKFA